MATGTITPTLEGTQDRLEESGYFQEGEEDMSCSCDASCPEPTEVTLQEQTVLVGGNTIEISDPVFVSITQKRIDIQVKDDADAAVTGRFDIRVFFCDSDDPNDLTAIPPTTPGQTDYFVVTDADGGKSITVINATLTTWWFFVSFGGVVSAGKELSVGA